MSGADPMSGRRLGRPEPDITPEAIALLEEATALARRFGLDPEFSRGGGGNVSAKADGVLHIKPSGVPLATLETADLLPLDMDPLLRLLHGEGPAEIEAGPDPVGATARIAVLRDAAGRRPSVELLFHAFLPQRIVLHTHPVLINAITCASDGEALAARLFGDRAVWVPYTNPGLPLARAIVAARAVAEARTGRAAPAITLMQNHGLIVAADSAAEIEELSSWLVSVVHTAIDGTPELVPASAWTTDTGGVADAVVAAAAARQYRARALVDAIAPTLRGLLGSDTALKIVTFDGGQVARELTATPIGRALATGGPLTPDQIVYAGSWPLLVDVPDATTAGDAPAIVQSTLDGYRTTNGVTPIIVLVPGLGLFAAGDTWAEADTARHVFLDALRVSEGAARLGGVRPLADEERGFIETWEAEAYRRGVASSAATAVGRFAGKVAIVTGAAQGFGLGIATDLVAEGGHVVLADVNRPLAEANAADLERRFGPGRATAVTMNVTDEQSVAAGVHATVERYGGLDVLVSNAGVLRAGAVTRQPLHEFDLVTSVNYRGYFLVVRFTAPVLALQHAARPGYWGDIIEINSKSGLTGSSRNSAYAGSKFGGIGLTQSFALELVGDGIKVNAICPGNFFDGPLWSDPDNGLFVQYLREGKVQGATTVDDVRAAYEAKVPMGRGCEPADVLRAIYYLVGQRYETGQALPVTGGQVMLS